MNSFEAPVMEIIAFEVADIITSSSEGDNAYGDSSNFQ